MEYEGCTNISVGGIVVVRITFVVDIRSVGGITTAGGKGPPIRAFYREQPIRFHLFLGPYFILFAPSFK